MKRFLHSVRLRLTLWYAGVLALVLAVFAISVYAFVVRTAQTSLEQALEQFGQQTSQAAAPAVQNGKLDVKKVQGPSLNRRDPILGYLVASQGGQTKEVRKGRLRPPIQQLKLALHSGNDNCTTYTSSSGVGKRNHPVVPLLLCVTLFKKHGHTVGGVEVIASLAGVDKALDRLRLALLLGVPIALLLAGSGGWILASRALEPVNRISRMARSITASDLSQRINLERQDELGRLAGTFDQMFDRLERAFQEQRQLTADVSHELRSPLTILEAQTSLALRRSRSSDEYRQALQTVQEEVERMSRMVNELLTLARADAGEEWIELVPVPLCEVARPVIDDMRPLAAENGVELHFKGDDAVWVSGDASRLRQLLLNLLQNALRHTPPGGAIDVKVEAGGGQPTMRVTDTGEGIAPEDLPHIFQRFYRGDRARQRATGSSGLGLAIVRSIVDAHGGNIRVRSEPGKGTEFTITLQPASVVVHPSATAVAGA